jgi:hypothetical protein
MALLCLRLRKNRTIGIHHGMRSLGKVLDHSGHC